jgi:hypothetical protein
MGEGKLVYHASSVRGLTRLVPSASTHGTWLHAVTDPVLAACFLSTTGGDLTCAVGRDRESGLPYLCERFAGAFEHRFAGAAGSIYVLDAAGFERNRTPWREEVVCDRPVRPLKEITIPDAAVHLQELAESGDLLLVTFPRRVDGIPEDDADLVERAVLWSERLGKAVLEGFAEYHPHLIPRIRATLERVERPTARRRAVDGDPR